MGIISRMTIEYDVYSCALVLYKSTGTVLEQRICDRVI